MGRRIKGSAGWQEALHFGQLCEIGRAIQVVGDGGRRVEAQAAAGQRRQFLMAGETFHAEGIGDQGRQALQECIGAAVPAGGQHDFRPLVGQRAEGVEVGGSEQRQVCREGQECCRTARLRHLTRLGEGAIETPATLHQHRRRRRLRQPQNRLIVADRPESGQRGRFRGLRPGCAGAPA